jgi:NADPH:quinone reductase-like Zn-dependent oxidoreductase
VIRVTRSCLVDAPIERVWAVLRDFNSHIDWHPIIDRSVIEHGESADQVGCVRNFTLKDGNQVREQLLTLSDRDHVSTYCILEATVPLLRYVATVRLKPVTDGNRTFWHWQSTFDAPRGRESEMAQMVGANVYEAGMKALREFLARPASRRATTPASDAPRDSAIAGAIEAPAIVMRAHGGPEVLVPERWSVPAPGAAEVRLRQTAVGVNFIDVYARRGLYPLVTPPGVPGVEAAGVVESVGEGVHELLPGDRVAYAALPAGAYAAARTIAAASVVRLPDDVSDEAAACLMLKGMTAEYLLHRTHRVSPGDSILVHAAAGATGLFVCQWARSLGARVLGTVSSEEKARVARDNGCEVPIVTRDYRFADAVLAATGDRGVSVVYDGLGAQAADENLRALALHGHWVSYGQASGSIESLPLAALSSKSITLSRPAITHFVQERATLIEMAGRVFEAYRRGILRLHSPNRFALADAAAAHRALESRATVGPLVLLP